MVRRPVPKEPQSAKMSADEMEKGIRRLQRRLDSVARFDPKTLSEEDPYSTVRPIETDIETALSETFGHDTIEYNRFRAAASLDWPIFVGSKLPHHEMVEYVAKDRQRSIQLLTAAISLLQERLQDVAPVLASTPTQESTPLSQRVFIVHGHDNEPKEAVARFLALLNFKPIILHEQANKGQTIIEKFRAEAADVGFAIVLMTPDDQVHSGGGQAWRARQNVVLELGFFLGALGPGKVAAIIKGDIEKPSDYDGVIYTPFDAGWKAALAKELQAAGYEIDWNKVMRS